MPPRKQSREPDMAKSRDGLTPCMHCGVSTPVEVICRRPAPERTLCPEHRRTANELLDAHVAAFVADCRAKSRREAA